MWGMAVVLVVVVIVRYLLRIYQQNQVLKEIEEIAQKQELARAKAVGAFRTNTNESEEDDRAVVEELEDNKSEDESVEEIKDEEEEDYDEFSTGHNVTKRLTAEGSRNFHLSSEQIQKGRDLNKELMERLAKRKTHAE